MMGCYRPSGPLRWLLERLPNQSQWDLIGALAAEPRANQITSEMVSIDKLGDGTFLCIEDEPSEFRDRVNAACQTQRTGLTAILGKNPNVLNMPLFSEVDELDAMYEGIERELSPNVVLDISAIPKRFFFYLVRRLTESASVSNLLVAYALPKKYGRTLHKNPGGWMPLPTFGIESSTASDPMLVVAVG